MSETTQLPEYLVDENLLLHEVYRTPKVSRMVVSMFIDEIFDPEFIKHTHGRRHTYNKGCHGLLCTKTMRDWQRSRTETMAARSGRTARRYTRDPYMMHVDAEADRIQPAYELFHAGRHTEREDPIRTAMKMRRILEDWDLPDLAENRKQLTAVS